MSCHHVCNKLSMWHIDQLLVASVAYLKGACHLYRLRRWRCFYLNGEAELLFY
jgi:hypothetical protein